MATVRYAYDIASGTIWIDGITIFVCFTKGTVVRGSCAAILWIAAGQCFTTTGTLNIMVGAGVPAHKPFIFLVSTLVSVPARYNLTLSVNLGAIIILIAHTVAGFGSMNYGAIGAFSLPISTDTMFTGW